MNVGRYFSSAILHAIRNAKTDGKPRYVWAWASDYWCDTIPPAIGWAGIDVYWKLTADGKREECTISTEHT